MSFTASNEDNFGGVSVGTPQNDPNDFMSSQDIGTSEMKPRILLTGRQRSGKTAISRVVFHKMTPNETLFLQSTSKLVKDSINHSSFVRFEVWEFPGQIDLLDANVIDAEGIFSGCNALIYIIDSQDDYSESLDIMRAVVIRAYNVNPSINFEVFIHKVDGLNDDHKIEIQRDIYQRAYDRLNADDQSNITLSFSLTSIYDHSIFEAFSKVVQKLIPQLATLEQMLSILVSNSGIEKAFLFDVVSKIYIATDSAIVDMQTYELCCDMIDVVIDMSGIYSQLKEDTAVQPYDSQSSSVIKLTNGSVMVLKEVNKYLALVCLIREEHYQSRAPLIDYNFICFRDGIQKVFSASVPNSRRRTPPCSPGSAHVGSPLRGTGMIAN